MADTKISALPASTVPLAGTEVLPIVQSSSTKQVSVANLTAGRDIAATSLTTAAVQATNSGGLALKNSGGTTQLSVGGGGGDNITLSVATNITPANAAVAISPTGTGTVAISPAGALTINPTTASTINNTSIGATTALTGRFTSVTATTGNFVVGTSGQGVDFSATPGTGTSELFADYEEGTFTPTIRGSTTAGTATYATQVGTYTKIGNTVFVRISLLWSVHTGTGDMNFGGLPFTSSSNTSYDNAVACYAEAITVTGQVTAILLPNTTVGIFIAVNNGTASNIAIDTAGQLIFQFQYQV
jgi:hypothetical protein